MMTKKCQQGMRSSSKRSQSASDAKPVGEFLTVAGISGVSIMDPTTLEQLRIMARAIRRLWRRLKVAPHVAEPIHAEHSQHTADISLMISNAIGLPRALTQRIYRAAYLHDVGSVAVAPAIFSKPGKLSQRERASMQAHSAVGGEMLAALLPSVDLAKIALAHHERYDGQGYPQGLVGTKIPLEARVLSIADSIDAMMSPRPYRQALTFAAAWGEVIREAGRQFDPSIVEAYTHMRKLAVEDSNP